MCIWIDVIGYEGMYMVSDDGQVMSIKQVDSIGRNLKSKILKPSIGPSGYKNVTLYKGNGPKTYSIHSLVARAWIGEKPVSKFRIEIDHKNGDKLDNRYENLEYVTNRENTSRGLLSDKSSKKSSKYRGVSWHIGKKKWCAQIRIDSKLKSLGSFDCEKKAYLAYKNALDKISSII
jgi:hypothetical protein